MRRNPQCEAPTPYSTRLVDDDAGLQGGVGIEPCRVLFCHIYLAVRPRAGDAVSDCISVGELCAGAIASAPEGVNDEVSSLLVENGIMYWRLREPVGRTWGKC